MKIHPNILIILYLLSINKLPATPNPKENPNSLYDSEKALFIVTPVSGEVLAELDFEYRLPYVRLNADGSLGFTDLPLAVGTKSFEGRGPGGGLELAVVYKRWSYASVNFRYQDTDYRDQVELYNGAQRVASNLSGSLHYLQYSFAPGGSYEPFFGLGYFQGWVDTNISNFTGDANLWQSFAYFPAVQVDNRIVNPFPKLGLKIHLPVQHWYVAPFVSYMYESSTTNISTGGGRLFSSGNEFLDWDVFSNWGAPSLISPPIRMELVKRTYQSVVGVNLFLDFHYFIQLRVKAYRNLTAGRWTARTFLTFMFHKNIGVSAYYEYSERSAAVYRYWLIGPSFVFQY